MDSPELREQIGRHNPAVLVGQDRAVDIPSAPWAAGAAKTAEIVAAVADTDRAAGADFESCRSPVCLAYLRRIPLQAALVLLDHFRLEIHYLALIIPFSNT